MAFPFTLPKIRLMKSLTFRISFLIVWLGFCTLFLISLYFYIQERRALESELEKRGLYITKTLAIQTADPFLYEDIFTLYKLVRILTQKKGEEPQEENAVAYGMLIDGNGRILIQQEVKEERSFFPIPPIWEGMVELNHWAIRPFGDKGLDIYVPIVAKEIKIGYARVGITKRYLNRTLSGVRYRILLGALGIVIGGVIVGLWLVRRVTHPLKQLTEGAKKIGAGNWGTEVKIHQSDEIGDLAQTFNQMSRQLKESIESIQRSQEKMIQAEKLSALGQLSAGLAHELKNPLTSIKMILQATLEGSSTMGMTKEDTEVILKEIKKLDTILTQFLDFAKPPRLQLQFLNLSDTIKEVFFLMKTELDRCGVEVIEEVSIGLPKMEGDHEKMKQVLVNLLLNSIQAMPGGGRLRIGAREVFENHREEILLWVEDSGKGIQREHLEKVFDPFFTTKERGTGLGLSIVYNIIKEHQGRIDIQSLIGKGTTITIVLPQERLK